MLYLPEFVAIKKIAYQMKFQRVNANIKRQPVGLVVDVVIVVVVVVYAYL